MPLTKLLHCQAPPTTQPTLSFDTASITKVVGEAVVNSLTWTDGDASPSNPVQDIFVDDAASTPAFTPEITAAIIVPSDLELTSGTASFDMVAPSLFGVYEIVAAILDGGGLQVNGSFTLTVQQPPTIGVAIGDVDVIEGSVATKNIQWTDLDASGAKPVASIVVDSGVGSVGSISDLTQPNGTAIWTHTNAQELDSGTITLKITDFDGHVDTATFELVVTPVSVTPPDIAWDAATFTPERPVGSEAFFGFTWQDPDASPSEPVQGFKVFIDSVDRTSDGTISPGDVQSAVAQNASYSTINLGLVDDGKDMEVEITDFDLNVVLSAPAELIWNFVDVLKNSSGITGHPVTRVTPWIVSGATIVNDNANGGATSFDAPTGYGKGVLIGDVDNKVTLTLTGDTGTPGSIGDQAPQQQISIPSGSRVRMTMTGTGDQSDDLVIATGPKTFVNSDGFLAEALFAFEIKDTDVVTIQLWSELAGSAVLPTDVQKGFWTLSDIAFTETVPPSTPTLTIDSASIQADLGGVASNSGSFMVGNTGSSTLSASIGTILPAGAQTLDGLWTWELLNAQSANSGEVTITNDDTVDPAVRVFDLLVTGAKPTTTLTGETTAANPGNANVVAQATPGTVGATITSEFLEVRGVATEVQSMPLAGNRLDLSAWTGETVTIAYTATDSEGQTSDEITWDVTVPNWVEILTVNLNQTTSVTNFHSITAAINALDDGSLLEIWGHPSGEYLLHSGVEPQRLLFVKTNCVMRGAEGENVVINGNYFSPSFVSTQNGAIGVRGSVNSVLQNITVTKSKNEGCYTGAPPTVFATDFMFRKVTCTGNDKFGFSAIGCTRTVFDECIGELTTIDRFGSRAANFSLRNDPVDTALHRCTIRESLQDGIEVRESDGAILFECLVHNNHRQGVVTHRATNLKMIGGEYYLNDACPMQIETLTDGFEIRGVHIHDNGQYEFGNAGEVATWIDDSSNGLVEYCDVHDNSAGGRADGDPNNPPDADPPTGQDKSEKVIFRFNKFYDNNGHPSQPGYPGGDYLSFSWNGSSRVYSYHNTYWNNGIDVSHSGAFNGLISKVNGDLSQRNFDNTFLNNISGKHRNGASGLSRQVEWRSGGDEFIDIDNNIYSDPPNGAAYELGVTRHDFAGYQTAMAPKEAASAETDPMISDVTLEPQGGSPAINAAVGLTEITNIGGMAITVDRPRHFWVGDIVVFENDTKAVVQSVTDTDIIVNVIPAGVAVGEKVTVFGAKDIGAVQVTA